MSEDHVDVLIVGAGLSGIGAACRLQAKAPDRTYMILEARERLGGTWDLFRYPGVRSDSDMYTLAYGFRPWREARAIVDGASILRYLQDTAREHDVERHIRFGWRVTHADWSSEDAQWRVRAAGADGRALELTCGFLFLCGGYYSYAGGHDPAFPGRAGFGGRVVHPQAWPEGLDYAGKRVVVIGSGATAVTLAPALARTAAQVVMLQRSPSYVVPQPATDAGAARLKPGARLGWRLVRWRHLLMQQWFYRLARRRPEAFKARVADVVQRQLGAGYDVATHFTPRYAPWDQRLCIAADADLFRAIRAGRLKVVTDTVERFTAEGLRLASGKTLAADIVVTATGLELEPFNGVAIRVDGHAIEPGKTLGYKGLMYEGVPNLAVTFGYTNASWTLRADLCAAYVCRLLAHMRRTGARVCTPRNRDPAMPVGPWIDFTSGYVRRGSERFPKQGDRDPWRAHQSYFKDLVALRFSSIRDGVLEFSNPARAAASARKVRKVIE